MLAWLQGKKVYITLIGVVVAGVVAYTNGAIDAKTLVEGVIVALVAAFGKAGLNRMEDTVDHLAPK